MSDDMAPKEQVQIVEEPSMGPQPIKGRVRIGGHRFTNEKSVEDFFREIDFVTYVEIRDYFCYFTSSEKAAASLIEMETIDIEGSKKCTIEPAYSEDVMRKYGAQLKDVPRTSLDALQKALPECFGKPVSLRLDNGPRSNSCVIVFQTEAQRNEVLGMSFEIEGHNVSVNPVAKWLRPVELNPYVPSPSLPCEKRTVSCYYVIPDPAHPGKPIEFVRFSMSNGYCLDKFHYPGALYLGHRVDPCETSEFSSSREVSARFPELPLADLPAMWFRRDAARVWENFVAASYCFQAGLFGFHWFMLPVPMLYMQTPGMPMEAPLMPVQTPEMPGEMPPSQECW